jgi:hypothetical protein
MNQILTTAWWAFAGSALLLTPATALAGRIVTDYVVSQGAKTQERVPVTFGQVFKSGDVPRGSTIAAAIRGEPVELQVDAKATYGDGSLRHAVLTANVASLPGNAKRALELSATDASAAKQSVRVGLQQLLATDYNAKVLLHINGEDYTADARALLLEAARSGACKSWNKQCTVWLAGPLVSEWVVNGPVAKADGTKDPNLRIYFSIRAYAQSSTGDIQNVLTDVIVENTAAYAPQAQPQYTATLTSGSATYTTSALTQYAYTRWHKTLWWNDLEPKVYLQQDTGYIQASKAVSRYMPLQPDAQFLDSLRQSCAPLDHCDQTQKMHMTGAQQAIGPLPRWTSVYIVDPDVRAYNWMLANTDALGAYDIHYRDAATGWPVSIQEHPNVTTAAWTYANAVAGRAMTGSASNQAQIAAYRRDLLPNCVNNTVVKRCSPGWYGTGSPTLWDNAHQPAESYVPYMVTGSYYYMSELAFAASRNQLTSNPLYRDFSRGLIDKSYSQVRGKAWVLRQMVDAAWLLPDTYPLKAEFNASVHNSLEDWYTRYVTSESSNPLHLMDSGATYPVKDAAGKVTGEKGIAPWMHDFFTWSAGHAAELGFPKAAELRAWLSKMNIEIMTGWQSDPTHGFCWLLASGYTFVVKDAAGNWLPDYKAVYAATYPDLVGLECNSAAMVAEMAKQQKQPWKAGQMPGYAYSPTGFPANLQVGLAAAADSGLPKAHEAWAIFQSRSVQPEPPKNGYNNYPNFAILPRSSAH